MKLPVFVLYNIVVVLLCFSVLEGISSFYLFYQGVKAEAKSPAHPEKAHTRYDAELGWWNLPNFRMASYDGKNSRYLVTNSRGHRNAQEFSKEIPVGTIRIICAGDSFTMGWGVSNEDAWCNHLSSLNPNIEAVNIGMGGFGFDQAFLAYRRESTALDHNILLFAFIEDDLRRMLRDSMYGYPKPFFTLEDNLLQLHNVPVPPAPFYTPWIFGAATKIPNLSLTQVLRNIHHYYELQKKMPHQPDPLDLAKALLREIHRIASERGATPIIVHLPVLEDFQVAHSEILEEFQKSLANLSMDWIDLYPDFYELKSETQHRRLFRGHYSVEGNHFVAKRIYKQLKHRL